MTKIDKEKLRKNTALSRLEVENIYLIDLQINNFMYVGNIGIKCHIPYELKRKVSLSQDTDIVIFTDNDTLAKIISEEEKKRNKEISIELVKPALEERIKYGLKKEHQQFKESPFFFYKIRIPVKSKKIDIDVFTKDTGLVFIPIKDEDKKYAIKREGLIYADLGFLIASMINPYAAREDRLLRINLALTNIRKNEIEAIQERVYKKIKEGYKRFEVENKERLPELEELSLKSLNLIEKGREKYTENIKKYGINEVYKKILEEEGLIS